MSANSVRKRFFGSLGTIFVSFIVILSTTVNLTVDRWNYTHWLFDYSNGFVRRGFVGFVCNFFGVIRTPASVSWMAFGLTTFFAVGYISYLTNCFWGKVGCYAAVLFIVWSLSMPGGIGHFYGDLGRFDVFGAMLILLGFVVIGRGGSRVLKVATILTISTLAILVHEAYVLWVVPMLLGAYYVSNSEELGPAWVTGLTLLFSLSVCAFVFDFSVSDYMTASEYYDHLRHKSGVEPHPQSVAVQFRTLRESILYNYQNGFSLFRLGGLLVAVLLLAPVLHLVVTLDSDSDGGTPGSMNNYQILTACCLAPLALHAVGHDHGRWWSMVYFNFSIFVTYVARRRPERVVSAISRGHFLFLAGIVANLAIGPFDVTNPL